MYLRYTVFIFLFSVFIVSSQQPNVKVKHDGFFNFTHDLQNDKIWRKINLFIVTFMGIIALYVLIEIVKFSVKY